MTEQVWLYGALSSHVRGDVLREVLSAQETSHLPQDGTLVLFGTDFQSAVADEQTSLVNWTREPGRVLLLIPPFASAPCTRPVRWSVERLDAAPRGGDGLSRLLADQITHRVEGQLQASLVPESGWAGLTISTAGFRLHPASGLFIVTCLPIWSLAVLDAPDLVAAWLSSIRTQAGVVTIGSPVTAPTLTAEHLGMLVFLLSREFEGEEDVLQKLGESAIFSIPKARARELLDELRAKRLVADTSPSPEATELVARSPYAPYLEALREVSQ